MADTIVLRFAQEELVYLLRALSIDTLPGLDKIPLGDLDQDHQTLALAVVDRSLRARGAVRWNNSEEREVDSLVAGVLREAAHSHWTLLFDILRADALNLRYLYSFGEYGIIEHCIPEPGIHQFALVPTVKDLLAYLNKLLALEEGRRDSVSAGHIDQKSFAVARITAATDVSATKDILASELPSETAMYLAAALHTLKVTYHFALLRGRPDQAPSQAKATLTIVQGEGNFFLLWQETSDSSSLEVIPATVVQAHHYVEQLLHLTR